MKVVICDLCGTPITGKGQHWKVKRQHIWWDGTQTWENLDVHDECVERIMNAEKFNQLWEEIACDSDSTTD